MKISRYILLVSLLLFASVVYAENGRQETFDPKGTIFEHLGDKYGWNIWDLHVSLPVIVCSETGDWYVFSSSRLQNGGNYEGFYLADRGDYAGKVVAVGTNGAEYRPWDFSITKNVLALMICAVVMCGLLFPLVRWYKKYPLIAPRKMNGVMEVIVEMLYKDVIVSVLGSNARRFAPYLLTVFFFILVANLMGLMVIFPGGANLMGNISITLVLSLCTFVVVNFSGRKHYWKEIFWPNVPTWLKCPVPMMPIIEIFGVLTKPIALMIRLFANMMGGHMITLVLISLIFIMSSLGMVAMAGTTFISVVFATFMGFVDLMICFIQAYVFFMLSTIFISLAVTNEEEQL